MAGKTQAVRHGTDEILKDILIVQLATAGLTQHQIREIVGVDMNRVSRIAKHFKRAATNEGKK